MGRRKKEEPCVHRMRIAKAAEDLFEKKGITATTMSEIANAAGYSKATLYVYFKNKEEVVGYLVLNSMKKLKDYLSSALEKGKENSDFKERFFALCKSMVLYQQEYPCYFSMVSDYINIDFENSDCEESARETFLVGEEINSILLSFLESGIDAGAFREQKNPKATLFSIWGMLSGLIELSVNKNEYISREIRISHDDFLETGFSLLYEAIICKP